MIMRQRIDDVASVKVTVVKTLSGSTIKTVTILTNDGSKVVTTCVIVKP